MIVEKDYGLDEWVVRDRGRGFRVNAQFAAQAYGQEIRFRIEEQQRGAFARPAEDVPPSLPPRLPDMREFLEMLATDRWERDGILPHPGTTAYLADLVRNS